MKEVKIKVNNLNVFFNYRQAINDVSLDIYARKVTALIGPSGCGKTSFLRTINRMNDLVDGFRLKGEVFIDNVDIYQPDIDVVNLRRLAGMIFQKPNLFSASIEENLSFALKIQGYREKSTIHEIVVQSSISAGIWDDIKERLQENALSLSVGQQQRLCIARALTVKPDILLLDEPASSLDPSSTTRIEELIHGLKEKHTIVVVTHNMQQAARISDYTAFLFMGQLIEYNKTSRIFTGPVNKQTEDYITGRFG